MARARTKPVPPPHDRINGALGVTREFGPARRTVYAWAAEGKITVWKLGRLNIYSRSEIEALIQPQRRAS